MSDYFGQFVSPEEEKRKRREVATQDYFGQYLPPTPAAPKPGIVSDIKRGFGQMVGGIGSAVRDLGAEGIGQNLENYGTDLARRNPSEISSFQDILESPLTTAREAVGEQVPQLGSMFTGARAGALLGTPFGPVGQVAGGIIGGLLPLGLQTYGGIRQEQREAGIDDKGRAILATVPSVALERLGGPERLVSKFARLGRGGMAREAGEAGLSLPGYMAREGLRGGLTETVTEIPQTGFERFGAYKDLTSPEAMNEYAVAGTKAFLGGGIYSGGFAAFRPNESVADTAGGEVVPRGTQGELFTSTSLEGLASPTTQQFTDLADTREALRARMEEAVRNPGLVDPLEYKEMRDTVERIDQILTGAQSDQLPLDLDPFRYTPGLQGRKEFVRKGRTNFQRELFAPEVAPDAPKDLLVPGTYTPTSTNIELPKVNTTEVYEVYARALDKARRGEPLTNLENYLIENPPENNAGVMTSETGTGTMQQRMLAGPQAFRQPLTAPGMRTREQTPTQLDMFGNPIDLSQATTLQPGPSVQPMQNTPLANLQQPGQIEMFGERGAPTYNAAPVDNTALAEARLRAEGTTPTAKRMEIAVKAEEALASGAIDELTYDQIFTLLRESKYAKAAKIVGEARVPQAIETKQTKTQGQKQPVPAAAAAAPSVEQLRVVEPQPTEATNAVQVESAAEVPVQPRAKTRKRVGKEVRGAQEPTAESRQEAKQDEEVAVEGQLTQREAVNRLMKEAGMPRADAKAQVEALVDGMGRVDAKAIDALVKKKPGAFARGKTKGGSSVAQVSSWLEPVKRLWGNAAPTEIVQSVADLPAKIAKDAPVDAKGLFYDGRVYIVADNHASRTDALVTLFHEMIGHYGIRSLVRAESTEYVRLMTKLENQNDRIRADAAAWRKNNPANIQYLKDNFGYTDTMIRAVSVEEAMADMAYEALQNPVLREKLANSPVLRSVVKFIAKALRAIGMSPVADKVDALTNNLDVFTLLSLSKDFVERGQQTSTLSAANVPMFSRGGMPSASETSKLFGDYGGIVAETIAGKLKRGAMGFRFLRDLKTSYASKLQGMSEYVDKAFAMGAMSNELLKEGGQIVNKWGALGDEIEPLNKLASFATSVEIHPDIPLDKNTHESNGRKISNKHLLNEDGKVDAATEEAYEKLQEMWKELSPAAKEVYFAARDYMQKTWMQRQDLLNRNVDAVFKPLMDEAKRLGNEAKLRSLTKERNKFIAEFGNTLAQVKGPYFPLMRFGDYYVSYKSDEFKAAEAELEAATQKLADIYGANDIPLDMKKEIDAAEKALAAFGEDPAIFGLSAKIKQDIKDARKELAVARAKVNELTKAGEKHYTNESYDSEFAAKLRAKELGVQVRMAQEYFRELNPITRASVEKLADAVGGTLPEGQAIKAREAMVQIYLAALPQTSALKNQIKRKGVAGADQDMLRAFSAHTQKDAHYLSRLAYMDDMTAALLKMQKDRRTQEQDAIYNEMARRHAASLQYNKSPIQDGIASLAFIYQLGVSPAFLLSNLTQPFMVSVPYMTARYKGKATTAMFKAFGDAGKAAASSFKKQGLHFEIDLNKFEADEKAMLESAMLDGLLDITLEMDIGAYAKGGSGVGSRAMRVMGALPHQVEVVNRVSTALAAYRLEIQAGKSKEDATAYAKTVLDKTHFDYSSANAPYYMKPGVVPLGKLLFQYRKYQLGMLTLMATLTRDTFKGATAIERKEARRALLGTFTTYGLFTGATGLPFVGTGFFIAELLGELFGDDDEPNDPEAEFRQYLADVFGVDGGVVAAKGLPAMFGVDASRILGAGDIAAPIRSIRWDKDGRDLYTEILISGLGPTLGGLFPQFAEGVKYMAAGDYYRGAQNLSPRFLRDGLKAMQMADEGVTTTKGNQVVEADEVEAADVMLQALGVPTTFITERQVATRAIEGAKQSINERRDFLIRKFVKARMDGDTEAMQDLREAIDKFNQTRRERGEQVIKWKDLTAAYKARTKYNRNTNEYGVSLSKKERALKQYGEFAAVETGDE